MKISKKNLSRHRKKSNYTKGNEIIAGKFDFKKDEQFII